jgi:hypothetical protein
LAAAALLGVPIVIGAPVAGRIIIKVNPTSLVEQPIIYTLGKEIKDTLSFLRDIILLKGLPANNTNLLSDVIFRS